MKTMNSTLEALESEQAHLREWFEHLHRHPELSMREQETAQYIADTVGQWGYDVATGVGKYGIVASLTVGDGGKAIGLRADFDALPIQEDNTLEYKSEVPGVAICVATTGTPPCSSRRESTSPRRRTSTEPCG